MRIILCDHNRNEIEKYAWVIEKNKKLMPGKDITREEWYKTAAGRRRVAGELKRLGEQLESLAITDELKIR